MRLITFETSTGPALGVMPELKSGDDTFAVLPELTMLSLIALGEAGLEIARKTLASGTRQPLSKVRLMAPIPEPRRNVFCLGWNYAEHSREAAQARGKLSPKEQKLPERPIFFTKLGTAVNRPDGIIPLDTSVTSQLDWEVELGVILGLGGKNIPREKAMEHVFGYTIINDVSAREVQVSHGGQFFKGKSLDGTCPMGPWIITADELPDPRGLSLRCRVNGELKQEGTTSDMIFDIPATLEWLSRGLTLLSGDVIATGTPSGVGFARTPPEFLRDGDTVECEVERIGILRNQVQAENR
jgi:2-keto-4-pentenoate hydratase/2-oxohepta-3-ene-1,7-dioic acid hydratase in catechol pathway